MEYLNLGNTGLKVSKICLGCMGFGELHRGGIPGKTTETEARKIIKYALDNGINFFDTANYYSLGTSEEILGKALQDFANRDDIVLATKLYYPMFEGSNAKGLSRKAIFNEVEKSLRRLQTDYIDLYIIHRFDYTTPIVETMEALNDLVRMGKIRYIGASSMYAWQFIKANSIAEKNGWTKFISMQNMYNLLYREEEKEMIPMCQSEGIGITPWSPLAHGVLAQTGKITRTDGVSQLQSEYQLLKDEIIIERVQQLATEFAVLPSQVALAWLFSKPYITAPIIGASKIQYVETALKSLDFQLTEEAIKYVEEPYVAHNQYGFR